MVAIDSRLQAAAGCRNTGQRVLSCVVCMVRTLW